MSVNFRELIIIWSQSGARDKFEELTALLIRSEFADASRIRIVHGDGGIDVHTNSIDDPCGIDVFQIKFFPDGISKSQKAQIRQSFKSVCDRKDFRTKSWTLCVPINLSTPEKQWFAKWKAKQAKLGIEIRQIWDELQLQTLLYSEKNRHLLEFYFYKRPIRPLKIVKEFTSSVIFGVDDNLPILPTFLDLSSPLASRIREKCNVARPYEETLTGGQPTLAVEVPNDDDDKFKYGVDALQCKILLDLCRFQRGGWSRSWTAGIGIRHETTTPITPEPINKIAGSRILEILGSNRFSKSASLKFTLSYSEIPFPAGTTVQLDQTGSENKVGPYERAVHIEVPGIVRLVFRVTALAASGTGSLPAGLRVLPGFERFCRTFSYMVKAEAELTRSGNHDDLIYDFRQWAEWLFAQIEASNGDKLA